ncbi:MAG: ankyrin repeat domain-containing protein [Lewinella sp.]|nr:ankyrin repeat domain-containing protein [Lewinella sp.]
MRTSILAILFLFAAVNLPAQVDNIFHDRKFWKAKPSVELIKQKIAEGYDPCARNEFAFDAVSYGIIDDAPVATIDYLLTLEGNPVTKPTHGSVTYLLWAAYKGNLPLMELLLDKGSDIQMATSRGTNILAMAAIGGVEDLEVYRMILGGGVDVHSTNSGGSNALLLLASADVDDESVYKYMVSNGLAWNSKDDGGNGLLGYAARGGNLPAMKMCVAKDLVDRSLNDKGENALFYAAYGLKRSEVQLATFKYLDSLGFEADMVNLDGQTPLHWAVRRGSPEVVDYFIEKGVNPNQVDRNGNTVWHQAARAPLAVIQSLRPHIADLNRQNHEGHSLLSLVTQRGNTNAFDYLVEHGADTRVVDTEGNDLLALVYNSYYARGEENFSHIINALTAQKSLLPKAYAAGNTLVHLAIEKSSTFLLSEAIGLGGDVNQQNDLGLSPLHLAAMKATDPELMDMLLAAGADKTLLTTFEESAYDLAAENELLDNNAVTLDRLKLKK